MASKLNIKQRIADFKAMDKADKRRWWSESSLATRCTSLSSLLIGIYIFSPTFLSIASIVNIITRLPIALGWAPSFSPAQTFRLGAWWA